jgi:hypothetical protein
MEPQHDVSPRDPWDGECQEEYANPNWEPLTRIAGPDRVGEFMWMGRLRGDGWSMELYKHRVTRRYLNIDLDGNTYRYLDSQYVPITSSEAVARTKG